MPARLIDEPIEVIAHFDEKGIHPLRFKWKDKAYRVSEIIFRPTDEDVKNKKIDFHVHVKGDSNTDYQLIFNIEDLSWKLGLIQRKEPGDDYEDDFYSSGRFDRF